MHLYELDIDRLYQEKDDVGEDGLDYLAESATTASNVFNPNNVGVIEFTTCLSAVIHAAQEMDKFKKALFRKRTREESGLAPLVSDPELSIFLQGHPDLDELFHGIVGGITEMGELAEVLYNLLAVNKEPDVTNVREEIGDNLWYLACLMRWAETTPLTEMRRNIAKLRLRHGESGFSKDGDMNRHLEEERRLLEGDTDQ